MSLEAESFSYNARMEIENLDGSQSQATAFCGKVPNGIMNAE